MPMLSVITLRDLINARVALGTMEMEYLAPVNYHDQYIFQKKKQCMYFNSLIFFISFHFKFRFSFYVLLLFLFLLFLGVGELKIV